MNGTLNVPFKPLERAVTQFLNLKAEAGSDESLIVARSMPVTPLMWIAVARTDISAV